MSTIFALVLSVALWPPMMIYRAYVIGVLWDWFVVPVIHMPAPPIYVMGGLLIVLHLCLPFQRVPRKNEDGPVETVINGAIVYGLLAPSSILFFGWTWHWLRWGVA